MSNDYIILSDEEEAIRQKALTYIKNLGIKQTHISKLVGLSDVSISLFLQSKRRLSKSKLNKLIDVIQNKSLE